MTTAVATPEASVPAATATVRRVTVPLAATAVARRPRGGDRGGFRRDDRSGGGDRGGYSRPTGGAGRDDRSSGGYSRPAGGGRDDRSGGGYNRDDRGGSVMTAVGTAVLLVDAVAMTVPRGTARWWRSRRAVVAYRAMTVAATAVMTAPVAATTALPVAAATAVMTAPAATAVGTSVTIARVVATAVDTVVVTVRRVMTVAGTTATTVGLLGVPMGLRAMTVPGTTGTTGRLGTTGVRRGVSGRPVVGPGGTTGARDGATSGRLGMTGAAYAAVLAVRDRRAVSVGPSGGTTALGAVDVTTGAVDRAGRRGEGWSAPRRPGDSGRASPVRSSTAG